MEVPPLWHYRCAPPPEGAFVDWKFASCVIVPAYRNGAWPVIREDAVQPAQLSPRCMRTTAIGLLVVVCPLCYDVRVFEEGVLKQNTHYTCPGHNGSAKCPGYLYRLQPQRASLTSPATCSIQ